MAQDQFGNYVTGLADAGISIGTYEGEGSPVGSVTPTETIAVYYDFSSGNTWEWKNGSWTLKSAT